MTNTATQQVNDIDAIEKRFMQNLGNNKLAARDFAIMINSVVDSRDTTVLTRRMVAVRDTKKDMVALRAMRATMQAVWPKGKFTVKDDVFSFKIKGVEADPDAVKRLNEASEKELGLRDTFVKHVKGDTEKPKFEAKDVETCVKSETQWVKNHDKAQAQQRIVELERRLAALKDIVAKS